MSETLLQTCRRDPKWAARELETLRARVRAQSEELERSPDWQDRKVIAALLKLASDEFGKHVCTDFDLEAIGLPRFRRRRLIEAMAQWGGDPIHLEDLAARDDEHEWTHTDDWYAMRYFAAALKGDE